ncbi:metallophosphoesterase family protein [Candidatus Neomarinimicrobiota bacterium]
MKLYIKIYLGFVLLFCFFACKSTSDNSNQLEFILAADWRHTATEKYHSTEYFMGALEAIEEVGKGSFMISPGDLDPVAPSANLISDVLGTDYPWYPVIGNHDTTYIETLREINKGGNLLPNIVHIGPPGSEETMYSFDYGNYHFVVVNEYYDGISDIGVNGDILPATFDWLEADLAENSDKHIFVTGHEPLVSIPDFQNGRHRHTDDSLNEHPRNAFKFHQLMMKYNVVAYLCGHTHSASYANINGLWQIDCGHARGTEDNYPKKVYSSITNIHLSNKQQGFPIDSAFTQYYREDSYPIKKVMFYMDLTDGISYKVLDDSQGYEIMKNFYFHAEELGEKKTEYFQTYWDNWSLTKSTFMKFRLNDNQVSIDIFRNDSFGGPYSLEKTIQLEM